MKCYVCIYRSEDEEFQEAVDLYTSGRLEESISLAKESLRHSRENLMQAQEADEDTEVEGMEIHKKNHSLLKSF